jgi:tRNA threonylcarbamoyladenosine biosynthesis protein TsaE
MDFHRETYGPEETHALGREFAGMLPPSAFVAFSGDLGSGKTAFINGMCEAYGCAEQVSSPTFTIVNEYAGSTRVIHCDLYRLETLEEMLQIGLDSLFLENGIVLVEWAERARPILPSPRFEIAAFHGSSHKNRSFHMRELSADDTRSILYAPGQLFRRKA